MKDENGKINEEFLSKVTGGLNYSDLTGEELSHINYLERQLQQALRDAAAGRDSNRDLVYALQEELREYRKQLEEKYGR